MKHPIRHLLLGLGTALFLAACGGGGGGGSAAPSTPTPTANATADNTRVAAGQTVTLDGSASTTPNGGTITYQWRVEQRPDGSTAELTTPTAVRASFTPDLPGNYLISLAVNDGRAGSTASQITLTVSNPNPVAVVIGQVSQLVNSAVQLDGSGSLAPEGGNAAGLSFAWTLTQKPVDSAAVLDNASRSQPRFTADKVGHYQATLVVSHGGKVSAPATVNITIGQVNALPVANAGAAITAVRGTRVALDGRASSDADGDTLQYRWRFAAGGMPYGSVAVIDNADKAQASFVPDYAGTYRLTLTVFDGTARHADGVVVTVEKPAGAPNTKPVAVISRPWNGTYEAERGVTVPLTAAYSTDIDGGFIAFANREWTLLSAPDGFDAATNWKTNGSFVGTHYGNYLVQLRVFDNEDWSDPVTQTYTIINGANRPPRAAAKLLGGSSSVGVGATATISAEDSTDPDANRLSYRWTLIDRPDGSQAQLSSTTAVNASFVADRAGAYIFGLVVTDEHGATSNDGFATLPTEITVMAKARNHAPVARLESLVQYTQEQPMVIGAKGLQGNYSGNAYDIWNSFQLNPNGYDSDDDVLSYLWTLSQAPSNSAFQMPDSGWFCGATGSTNYPGSTVVAYDTWRDQGLALRNWTCDRLGLAPTVAGAYQLQLAVSDGIEFGGPYTVNLHAVERANYPSLLLEHMNRQHTWSNDAQNMVLQSQSPALDNMNGLPQQEVFPFANFTRGNTGYANAIASSADLLKIYYDNYVSGDFVVRSFRLTAGGGDYTVTNLSATDSDGRLQPRFVGLSNGQVIPRGQTVEFQLVLAGNTLPAQDGNGKIIASRKNLTWSFGVQEKPNFTFSFNPTIAVY